MSKQRAKGPSWSRCGLVHYSPTIVGTLSLFWTWPDTIGLRLLVQRLDYHPFETHTVQQRSHWPQVRSITVE